MSRMWLIGGGVFVAVLLLASIAIALTQKEEKFAAGTPERTVQIYLKALEDEDYAEAYSYFGSEVKVGCAAEQFATAGTSGYGKANNNRVTLKETRFVNDAAVVTVRLTYISSDGPFSTGQYSNDYSYTLKQEEGQWKFTQDPQWPFFGCGGFREPKPQVVIQATLTPVPTPRPAPPATTGPNR